MEYFENEKIEQEKKLQFYKDMIDNAYDTTKNKYGSEFANRAMIEYFLGGRVNGFTRENKARANMIFFEERINENAQVLLDYAISSFMINEDTCDISNQDLTQYANDKEGKLNYDSKHITKVVAVATAVNVYWASNLISLNKKLREALLVNFITERYGLNKRNELDNSRKSKPIKLTDKKKIYMMSKYELNNCIRNMNADDEIEDYVPTGHTR